MVKTIWLLWRKNFNEEAFWKNCSVNEAEDGNLTVQVKRAVKHVLYEFPFCYILNCNVIDFELFQIEICC